MMSGSTNLEREEKFRWSEVKRGVFNVQIWLTATAYFAILSGLYSFGLFLPTIINDMHITSDANQTQLWSVIPYAVATPVTGEFPTGPLSWPSFHAARRLTCASAFETNSLYRLPLRSP